MKRRLALGTAAVLVITCAGALGSWWYGVVDVGDPSTTSNTVRSSPASEPRVIDAAGLARLSMPPGAPEATLARASQDESARLPPLRLAKPVSELLHVELASTPLASPATLTLTYDPALLPPGVEPDSVFVGYYEEATGAWTTLAGVVDAAHHTVEVETNHASFWQAFAWWRDATETALYAATNLDIATYWNALHLYSDCNGGAGSAVIIDDSLAHELATACIERDDLRDARLRIVGRRILYLTLVPEPHGVKSGDFVTNETMSPVETFSFGADFDAVKTRDDNFTVLVRFDEYGVANQVLDIELKAIPLADQIPQTGRSKLVQCLLGIEGIAEVLRDAQTGDRQGVFESSVGLMTNPKNLKCIESKLKEIGISIGQEGLSKVTAKQLEQLFKTIAKIRLVALTIEATELATHVRGAEGKIVFYSNKPFPLAKNVKPAPTGTAVSGPIVLSTAGSIRVTLKSANNACNGTVSVASPAGSVLWTGYNSHIRESQTLGPFPAGAKLTFTLAPGSFCKGSFSSVNPSHARVTRTATDAWTIEWEDTENGDADFNDLIMTVERVTQLSSSDGPPSPPTH